MRAVNLIPAEERRGGSAGGRSGNAAYAVLGILAVLVLMAAAYTLTGKTVKDRRSQLASVEQQASSAENQATKLAAYSSFSDLRKARAETVASIARSRFDWAHVMHEVARIIPSDTHLTSLSGTVSPTAPAPSGGGSALQLRGTNPGPAIDIVGCAKGQSNVSRMMSRLRLIDGVQHVTLAESAKNDTTGSGGATTGGGDSGECRYNDAIARFDVLIIFAAPPAAAAPATAAAPGAAPAAGATGTATPASTTTPTGSTP
jgi:Tfp pilus assembly protein PilN